MVFRQIAKDSAIYGGADFLGKSISFFTFPIIAAAFTPTSFGTLELVRTTTALLALVMNFGLNNSVQRFYWDSDTTENQRPIIVSTGLATQILFGLLTCLLGFSLMPWTMNEVQKVNLSLSWIGFISALLLMFFSQCLQYCLDVIRLQFSPFKFLFLTFLSRILSVLLSVLVVVKFKGGINGFLSIQLLVNILAIPLAFWMIKKDLTLKIDLSWLRELVVFGYPFIFAGLAYWLFGSMDRWMLATISSVEQTGLYSIAFRFASIVLFVSAAFGKAWSPISIKLRKDYPDEYRNIYAQVLLLILFCMLTIGGGLSLLSGELITIMMPQEYAASSLPLTILCFGIILQATQQVTAIGISLEKKTYIFAHLTWATAGINLFLNWLLIPRYGAIGAAWATSISYLVLTSSYLYFTQRLHPLPIPWLQLFGLLGQGLIIAIISICFPADSIQWSVVIYKLLFILVFLGIAYITLPLKSLNDAR
ncbi:flippase [Acaryochloris marina]|uniref:Polysaccharide biosynthesis protein, putative n=1 Tax=Acaryochloris marina (strain MBIC 11017) TaxID=329726 RepID=B0BZH0_ACAM1|nr:flippase [Acaryochloris marina]ABW30715.1 polysaccharide biosynthesis protein, putative [Acaryochloris marina MBIC11017]BDM79494.1 LPS biosynthesis protein [Acaryochloris marina MBIC10699]